MVPIIGEQAAEIESAKAELDALKSKVGKLIPPAILGAGRIYDVRAFGTLAKAITYIGSNVATLYITNEQAITTNTTIPSNISIVVLNGGSFAISTGVTLTIENLVPPGSFQWISGAGTLTLGRLVQYFDPSWWGLSESATAAAQTLAFQRMFTQAENNGGRVHIPKPSAQYLISGDIGIRNGTTPVYVNGNGCKIKRDATSSGYNMFRFRSNMTVVDVELEGHIQSGTGESDVVPSFGMGFRSGPFVDNVLFSNCYAYGFSFDGYYIEDENDGGHVVFKNCRGNNNWRNDFSCVRANYCEIDGGIWGNNTSGNVIVHNASIDFEEDLATPTRVIRKAVVRNATIYHKLGFSGIMGANHEGTVENVTFNGSIYGAVCGLFWTNYKVMRLGYFEHINGAQPSWMGALPWANRQVTGRFVLANRGQAQANSLMSTNTHLESEWTTSFNTGGATLTEGVVIGDRRGIRLENGSGGAHNYLEMIIGVTVGEIYSFGCLIRKDEGDDFDQGVWVKCIGSGMHPFHVGPTAKDNTERICAAILIPTGTTSVEIYVGANSDDPYDITFADFYFCRGLVDNESHPIQNRYMAPRWAGLHNFDVGLEAVDGEFVDLTVTNDATIHHLSVGNLLEVSNAIRALGNLALIRNDNTSYLQITGGNGTANGANMLFLGGAHATAAGDWSLRSDNQDVLYWDYSALLLALTGSLRISGRWQRRRGSDIASANDLTLGADGNSFGITGTTDLRGMATANWQSGSEVKLFILGNITIKHNTAPSAGFARFILQGAADFVATSGAALTVEYDGAFWQETARRTA